MVTKEDLKKFTIDDFRKFKGIPWKHGDTDCYGLIRKVYKELFEIELNDYERKDGWWNDPEKYNLYKDNYEKEGFCKVEINENNPFQIGDFILMDIFCGVPAHAALYIGDNHILHHFSNRVSGIEPYIKLWKKTTVEVIRHKNFL